MRSLANQLGFSVTYLFDLENGNREPTEKVILALIKFYNLSFEEQRRLCDSVALATGKLPFDVVKFLENNPDVLEDIKSIMRERNLSSGGR